MTVNLARALGASTAALSVEYLGIPASFGINRQAQELAGRSVSHLRASIELLRRRRQRVVFLVIVGAVGFASDPVTCGRSRASSTGAIRGSLRRENGVRGAGHAGARVRGLDGAARGRGGGARLRRRCRPSEAQGTASEVANIDSCRRDPRGRCASANTGT